MFLPRSEVSKSPVSLDNAAKQMRKDIFRMSRNFLPGFTVELDARRVIGGNRHHAGFEARVAFFCQLLGEISHLSVTRRNRRWPRPLTLQARSVTEVGNYRIDDLYLFNSVP